MRATPESAFTLSAFGLPEPGGIPSGGGPGVQSWFFGGGALLFGAAVVLRQAARRAA